MTEAEKYGLLVNIIVPVASAIGAAYVSLGVIQNYAALLQAGKSNLCLMPSAMRRGQYR